MVDHFLVLIEFFYFIANCPLPIVMLLGCTTEKNGGNIEAVRTNPVSLPAGPVALIVSTTANETVKELESYNLRWSSGFAANLYTKAIRKAYIETSDPYLSVGAVVRMLENRFGSVQRFQSFDEASHNGYKLVANLDMRTQLMSERSSQLASYLSLEFYTIDHLSLGVVESIVSRTLSPVWAGAKREDEIISDIRQQGEVQVRVRARPGSSDILESG